MTLLKIFSKQIILVAVACLPALAQSSKMRTVTKGDTGQIGISPTEISTHRDPSTPPCPGENVYSYFKGGYIVDKVSKF